MRLPLARIALGLGLAASAAVIILVTAAYVLSLRLRSPISIHEAASQGDVGKVVCMVESDPNLLHARDANGNTALDCAILAGHFEVVKVLVDKGADVNPSDGQEWAPLLSTACRHGKSSTRSMLMLLKKGANVDFRYEPEGWTALSLAAANGMDRKVEILLQWGANPNVVDVHGETPLDSASIKLDLLKGAGPSRIRRQMRIVKLLKQHGALRAQELPVPKTPVRPKS